jgi:hypothetical protein
MSLPSFKLEKLNINVYGNRLRIGLPKSSFEVMFNPESFSMKHENVFEKLQGINTSGRTARYSHSRSDQLALTLLIDGTGVSDYLALTLLGFGHDPVAKQIETLLELCFYMDGDIHEPRFLKIQWGEGPLSDFDCRLQSLDIKYTAFERNGAPLRAELDVVFIEDVEPAKRLRQEGKNSPDLSHRRTVKAGDRLPQMCQQIYGDAKWYPQVAKINGLDHFRELTLGQELIFPPLAKD